jgi:hypothetical protein
MNIGMTSNPPLIRGRIKLSVVDLIVFHQRLSVFVAFRRSFLVRNFAVRVSSLGLANSDHIT